MPNIPVKCMDCGSTATFQRIAADLHCGSCGSFDVDIDDAPVTKTALPKGPGTGWGTTLPDSLQDWNEYQGPAVGHNPKTPQQDVAEDKNGSLTCPACGGTGHDTRASGAGYDENTCRLCGGSGKYTPPTSTDGPTATNDAHTQGPPVGGARLASSPSVVPIPVSFTDAEGRTWTATATVTKPVSKKASVKKTSKLDQIVATIKSRNAVTDEEALALAQRTLEQFPETSF